MASYPPPPGGDKLPPLPPGWTEHRALTGQLYYYHASTNHSTYVRPLPLPGTIQQITQPTKKEKPLYKILIPNTSWLRVKTNHGNIFFTHTERKESVWVVPEEIKDAVTSMDWSKLEEEAAQEKERKAQDKEVARLAAEIENDKLKRKAQESEGSPAAGVSDRRKRKKHKAAPVSQEPQAIHEISIQAVSMPQPHQDEEADEDEEEGSSVFSNPEEEEQWQREMAEDMAVLAAEEAEASKRSAEDDKEKQEDLGKNGDPAFTIPNQVNLSQEEAKTLFKTLLTEKSPSYLVPFSSVMPSLITDPRYVLLPSQTEREATFNEWCREASRAARLAKISVKPHVSLPNTSDTAEADVSNAEASTFVNPPKLNKEGEKKQAREAYDALLNMEVTSTRTTWEEFKRNWKKDRRFFGFARDDREREKVFRAYLRGLGEKKRAQAKQAEVDFMDLLKEHKSIIPITPDYDWKEVKKTRSVVKDPRYDAVGSSTLREELFGTFLKALCSNAPPPNDSSAPAPAGTPPQSKTIEDRRSRAERALQERKEQARAERDRVQKGVEKNKAVFGTAEAEEDLMSLYVDSVRDPKVSYREFESTFTNHPRFASSPLSTSQKQYLFSRHIAHLANKHRTSLDALFLEHAHSLAMTFSKLPPSSTEFLDASLPAQKLGLRSDDGTMERAFDDWMQRRTEQARRDFDALLRENSFVEFWGKVRKLHEDGEGANIIEDEDDLGIIDDGNETGKTDIKTLAKSITENETDRVLKNDQRYRAFDHIPEQRMRWVKDYLSSLSAPKLSVHVPS